MAEVHIVGQIVGASGFEQRNLFCKVYIRVLCETYYVDQVCHYATINRGIFERGCVGMFWFCAKWALKTVYSSEAQDVGLLGGKLSPEVATGYVLILLSLDG